MHTYPRHTNFAVTDLADITLAVSHVTLAVSDHAHVTSLDDRRCSRHSTPAVPPFIMRHHSHCLQTCARIVSLTVSISCSHQNISDSNHVRLSPSITFRDNCTGWYGVKHQLLINSLPPCLPSSPSPARARLPLSDHTHVREEGRRGRGSVGRISPWLLPSQW